MRDIRLTIFGDTLVPNNNLAGYSGEHLNTRLAVSLPESWRGEYIYHLLFHTSRDRDGEGVYTAILSPVDGSLIFEMPQAIMVAGILGIQVRAIEPDTERTMLSASTNLEVKESIVAIDELDEEYNGLLAEAAASVSEFVEEFDIDVGNIELLPLGSPASGEFVRDGFGYTLNMKVPNGGTSLAGQPNGLAQLNGSAKVPVSQLPEATETQKGILTLAPIEEIENDVQELDGRITTVDNRITAVQNSIPSFATQAEAEAGQITNKTMSPVTTKQAATKFMTDNAAAQIPTIAGSATTRDLTVPAGANPNRLTILLSSAVTATSNIRLRVGTGAYYNIVMPSGSATDYVEQLSAYVPYDLVLANIGGTTVWVCPEAIKVRTLRITNGANFYDFTATRHNNKVTIHGTDFMSLGTGQNQDVVVGTIPVGFRPKAGVVAILVTRGFGSGAGSFGIYFASNGNIYTYSINTSSAMNGVPGSCEYFV